MTAEVLGVIQSESGTTQVVIQLRSGEFSVGMKLRSKSSHWRIVSFGFIPAESYARGLRAIVVRPDGPVAGLSPGDVLVSV
jgi:hypothetical protein